MLQKNISTIGYNLSCLYNLNQIVVNFSYAYHKTAFKGGKDRKEVLKMFFFSCEVFPKSLVFVNKRVHWDAEKNRLK